MDESTQTIFWLRRALDEIVNRLEALQQLANDYRDSLSDRERRERETAQRNAEAIAEQTRLAHAIERKRSAEHKQNLRAQRIIGFGTWAAVVAACIYAGVAADQLSETRKQVSIVRNQLEVTDRPRVKIEITACTVCGDRDIRGGPLTFDKTGRGSLTFRAIFKNIGNSVADNVTLRYRPTPIGAFNSPVNESTTLVEEQKRLCSESNEEKGFNIGSVFPQDTHPEVFGPAGFDTSNVPDSPPDLALKNGKAIDLFVVGCVDYEWATSSKPHQTGFIYSVTEINPPHGIQTLMTIPVDRLSFEAYGFGGQYAN